MAKKERYYEGTTSANTIVKDLSKVLCVGVQDDAIVDSDGTVLKKKQLIKERNWDIIFPAANLGGTLYDESGNEIVVQDQNDLTADEQLAKINQQVSRIKNEQHDRVILKAKTTPVGIDSAEATDALGLENDLNTDSIDMYLEIYKPKYLIDLENYHPETEMKGILPAVTTIQGFKESVSTTGEKSINVYDEFFKTDRVVAEDDFLSAVSNSYIKRRRNDSYIDNNISSRSNSTYAFYDDLGDVFNIDYSADSFSRDLLNFTRYGDLEGEEKNLIQQIIEDSTLDFVDNDEIKLSIYADDITKSYNTRYNDDSRSTSISLYLTLYKKEYQQKYSLEASEVDVDGNRSGFYIEIPEENPRLFTIESTNGVTMKNFNYIESEKILIANVDTPNNSSTYFDALNGSLVINYEFEKDQATLKKTELVENHHHVFMRIFDKINPEKNGPADISKEPHISEWSKLSWYLDFEELAVDELDESPGTDDISKGVVNLPTVTPGLDGNTRIQFWVNTSNDTVSLVVMGNPSLEFGSNKHISSFGYIGRVKSFDNSINDTAGNFALATSSTTVPCLSKTTTRIKTDEITVDTLEDGIETLMPYTDSKVYTFPINGSDELNYEISPKVLIITKDADGQPDPTKIGELDSSNYDIDLPNMTGVDEIKITLDESKYSVPVGDYIGVVYYTKKGIIETSKGAVRDGLGNMIEINLPDTYGINTATGVTDISMLHTRSKAYYQRHHLMFTTTNEYMKKEQYGKSAYTSEYYADRAKIVHGNDGPRGMLKNILIIDTSSLVALDELVINRDHEKDPRDPEETFVYFPITAPYSPLTTGPNSMYGIAIKKKEVLPEPLDEAEALARDIDNLFINDKDMITQDVYLPETGAEGSTIVWASSDSNVITILNSDEIENTFETVTLADVTQPIHDPDVNNDTVVTLTASLTNGTETSDVTFEVLVKESGMGDSAAVTNDLKWISMPSSTGENLTLPTSGPSDTNIVWDTSTSTIIDENGIITRPANGELDSLESIKATVSKGKESAFDTFEINILAWTDTEELQLDYEYMESNGFELISLDNTNKEAVTTDLDLLTLLPRDTTVTWVSTNNDAINPTTGVVTRPDYNDVSTTNVGVTVNLRATLTSKDTIETKLVSHTGVIVLKLPKTDEENIYNATSNMLADDIVGTNVGQTQITDDFFLPKFPNESWDADQAYYGWTLETTDELGNPVDYSTNFSIAGAATDINGDGTEYGYQVTVNRPTDGTNINVRVNRRTTSPDIDGDGTPATDDTVMTFTVQST